ncbi:hypothetical protein CRM22_010585 [Opisthorchis felineus]|uniref:B box-type domain-containing protein n=1 Tax=Opisthorchis felineus TaxID=147828 RepID=A0A4S2KWV0_OPIFE|nr:hypothetical protein CRM22_010585 [Opisthorchis felineus]
MLEESRETTNGVSPSFDDNFSKSASLGETTGLPLFCDICEKQFNDPVILSCLHVFDRACLKAFEKQEGMNVYVKCPRCGSISGGLDTLETYNLSIADPAVCSGKDDSRETSVQCSVCTEGNEAVYRCLHCAGTLCERCRDIHKVIKLFSHHEVLALTEKDAEDLQRNMQNSKPVPCAVHRDCVYMSFCMQCHVPLCEACYGSDHKGHITSSLDLVPDHIDSLVSSVMDTCTAKQRVLKERSDVLHNVLVDLSASRDKNSNRITDTYNQWKLALDRIKEQCLQRNRELHDDIEVKLWGRINDIAKVVDHVDFACEFSKSYLKRCSSIEMCKLTKNVLACFDRLEKFNLANDEPFGIEFTSRCAPQDFIRQHFGGFDTPASNSSSVSTANDPLFDSLVRSNSHLGNIVGTGDVSDDLKRLSLKMDNGLGNGHSISMDGPTRPLVSISPTGSQVSNRGAANLTSLQLGAPLGNGDLDPFISHPGDSTVMNRPVTNWGELTVGLGNLEQPEFLPGVPNIDASYLHPQFLSSGLNQSVPRPVGNCTALSSLDSDPGMLLKQRLPVNYNANLYEYCRMRAARCSQMNLLTKWGSLGYELGRLNSPHGFCLGFEEEIVVADTYNHRIQIFTKRGDFVSFFGVSGRVDGLLWYPRKVAIIRQSQRYVVCDRGNERSRMQLFSRSGHFVRRIPIRYIDIVAGLAINQHGHIVAIDSVSPSVFVVSEEGDLIRWFDCSSHMREPSDVAIHGREYYICDFKAHCVIVFQEDGTFIRKIGGETITNFPNGIDVSDHGDVLVGDSHGNRFHIAVFSRTGELLSEFVCNQTKVSRSCCLKITTEGYVVTLARSSNNVLVLDTLYIC